MNNFTDVELEHIKKQAFMELSRRKYIEYVKHVHKGNWLPGKHLQYICNDVELLLNDKLYTDVGNNVQILIISMPPQHGKSQCISETLPSWYLGHNPAKKVIIASYNTEFASRFGRKNIQKISEYASDIFGIKLSREASDNFELTQGGSCICRGVMSGITGNPADLIIIDDPIKNREEADSETYREKMWDEYLNSLKTRLSAKGKIILIQTRWHEDDLAGRIIKNEPDKVKVINFPCEAEENDILGRNIGDSLFPEIGKDNYWLDDFKRVYTGKNGSRAWFALFQGRPTAAKGNLINTDWWKYYDSLPDMMRTIMSVDASFKDGEHNDYTCIQVWGKRENNIYLIECVNEKLDFPNTVKKILEVKDRHKQCATILIEDKANGSAIIQTLKRQIAGIIAVNPYGGKVSRLNSVSAYIESGNVYLPSTASWLSDFLDQCSSFPNGKHDDMVDAMSQALARFAFYNADLPPEPKQYNFTWEKPEPNRYIGGEVSKSYINY